MAATDADQVIEEFTKYFNAGDVDGLASVYEDGAVLLPEAGASVGDAADLRGVIRAYLDLKGTITITASKAFVKGDLALAHSRWRLEIPGEESMEGTSAEVARRQPDGTWKYVIDNPYGDEVLG